MKICVFGAGAIGGLVGARLNAAGSDEVTLIARGPHLAAMKQNGLTLISEGRANRHAPILHRQPQGSRTTGRRHPRRQSERASGHCRRDRSPARPLDGPGADRQRRAVVVFLQADRPVREHAARDRRPRRHSVGATCAAPRDWLRGLSGRGSDRARRDRAHLFQSLRHRRAGWIEERARAALRTDDDQGGVSGADPPADSRQPLGEAVGQSLVQSRLRVDDGHARSRGGRSGHARGRAAR